MKNAKVACYIDGFNLYHAIKSLPPPNQHLKWVDLWGLASAFIRHSEERLVAVYYFSALAYWLPAAQARHEAFIAANRALGVTAVLGRFQGQNAAVRRLRRGLDHARGKTERRQPGRPSGASCGPWPV